MAQGLKNLQDSAKYKRTAENIQIAKEIAKEKTSGMVAGGHHCLGLLPEYVLCLRSGQDQDLQLCVPAVIQQEHNGQSNETKEKTSKMEQ